MIQMIQIPGAVNRLWAPGSRGEEYVPSRDRKL